MILFFIGIGVGIFIGIRGFALTHMGKMRKHTDEEMEFIKRF